MNIFITIEQKNVDFTPSTKRSKRLAVNKMLIRLGALALYIKVIFQDRPQGLQLVTMILTPNLITLEKLIVPQ